MRSCQRGVGTKSCDGLPSSKRCRFPGMCRFLMYQSTVEQPLSNYLKEAPHALVQQALAPRELNPNLPSADGWGVAWYTAASSEPGLYRTVLPMWRDANLESLSPHIRAAHFMAATRVATGDSELALVNNQPFVRGSLSFAHNGELEDFEVAFLEPLRRTISASKRAVPRGMIDSAHLFALLLDAVAASEGKLDRALDSLVDKVSRLAHEVGRGATLNLLASNGDEAVAVRYATPGQKPPSLYWREVIGGVLVASEPLDEDPAWRPFDPNTRMTFRGGERCASRRLGP